MTKHESRSRRLLKGAAQYRGGDPANCARKLTRAHGFRPFDTIIKPWFDHTHVVHFTLELEAGEKKSAISETVLLAAAISRNWEFTSSPVQLTFTTSEPGVSGVESLTLALDLAQFSDESAA